MEPSKRRGGRAWRSAMVIAIREIHQHCREPLVATLVLFASVLAGFSTHVAVTEMANRAAASATLTAERDSDRAQRRGPLSGWQVEPSLRLIRTPEPLSVIVSGVDATMPQFWDVGPAGLRTGPSFLERGEPSAIVDIDFVIRVVLGLLAILLATESIAGERANGTLLALLGQPIQPRVVLAGKLAGSAVTVGAAIAIVLGVALVTAALSQRPLVTAGFVRSALGVGAVGWLYLCVQLAIGALTSSVFRSQRAALAAAAVVWLIGGSSGTALPQVIARSLAPVDAPSLVERRAEREFQARLRQVQLEMGDRYLAAVPAGADWTRVDQTPALRSAVAPAVESVWQRHVAAWRAEQARAAETAARANAKRTRILQALMMVSYGGEFTMAAANIAGTGTALAHRWHRDVEGYQAELNRALFFDPPRLTLLVPAEPRRGPGAEGRYVVGFTRRAEPTPLAGPGPAPRAPTPAGQLADAAPHVAILLLYLAALSGLATITFERMRR